MSFLKAIVKYPLRAISDGILHMDKKTAQKKAYSKTGKTLKAAWRTGERVKGSTEYKRQYNAVISSAEARKVRRDKFIDEL